LIEPGEEKKFGLIGCPERKRKTPSFFLRQEQKEGRDRKKKEGVSPITSRKKSILLSVRGGKKTLLSPREVPQKRKGRNLDLA